MGTETLKGKNFIAVISINAEIVYVNFPPGKIDFSELNNYVTNWYGATPKLEPIYGQFTNPKTILISNTQCYDRLRLAIGSTIKGNVIWGKSVIANYDYFDNSYYPCGATLKELMDSISQINFFGDWRNERN